MDISTNYLCRNTYAPSDDFINLYQKCYKKLYITALFMLKNSSDAEDAVQDAALSAMQNFNQLKNIDCFESWIIKILINRCKRMNFLKFKFVTEDFNLDIAVEDPDCEALITIKNELLKLPSKYRLVITLRFLNDLSIRQISDILNIPEGTIKSQINRGIKELKNRLKVE